MSVPPRQLKLGGTRRPPPPRPLSVSQLVRQASRRLESQFGEVWVEGEVSNLSRPRSGHLYFTLKDDRSQLSVVLFRSSAARLRFEIQDGQLASVAFAWVIAPSTSNPEKECIRKALLAYCRRDTEAMVGVFQELQSLSGV